MKKCKQKLKKGRHFDEQKAFYDMTIRNHLLVISEKLRIKRWRKFK